MQELRFDEKNHEYYRGRRKLLGVTTVLASSGLCDMPYATGVEYLDRGTLMHDLTARMDGGERVDRRSVPRRWRGCLAAWEKYRADTGIKIKLIEHRVGSDRYAGTLDRVVEFPRARLETVLDLKFAKTGGPGDWVRYQLVAYGHALDPRKLFGRTAVTLHEDGTYKARHWDVSTWLADLHKFLEAVKTAEAGNAWMDLTRRKR